MARGNRRERIFRDDIDRRFFLRTLGETSQRTVWIHSWVLLSNHYHLFIETAIPAGISPEDLKIQMRERFRPP
jgi:REP element-mobilizing transposase RayT